MDSSEIYTLVIRAAHGDSAASRSLFYMYKGLVLRIVYHNLGPWPKPDIEDVVQQVFIELFKSLKGFKGECGFESWVYRICSMVCLQRIRSKYRKKNFLSFNLADDEWNRVADDAYLPDTVTENKELIAQLYAALNRIAPDRRTVFVMAEIEGKPIEEISRILRIAEGTVKSRLHRAKKDLAAVFDRSILTPAAAGRFATVAG